MEDTSGAPKFKGQFPNDASGPLSADRWADVLGVQKDRVNAFFREKKVPRKLIGKNIYVRPSDLWNAIPFLNEEN